MTPECPDARRECLINPIDLENRLTRIEVKLDQVIEAGKDQVGISGKSVAGLATVISALVIGVIEGVKAYFTKG